MKKKCDIRRKNKKHFFLVNIRKLLIWSAAWMNVTGQTDTNGGRCVNVKKTKQKNGSSWKTRRSAFEGSSSWSTMFLFLFFWILFNTHTPLIYDYCGQTILRINSKYTYIIFIDMGLVLWKSWRQVLTLFSKLIKFYFDIVLFTKNIRNDEISLKI